MTEEPAAGTPGTFALEAQLPRVPLPRLQDSARRFLDWCSPLLTPDEVAATERAVAAFLGPGSPAHALQAALEAYDARPDVDSWLDDFWRQRYLGRRDRIALNANFFFLFEDAPAGQVERAAALVAGALALKAQLDQERLPPVVQRGRPLSMEQTKYLFSTTRIPRSGQDDLRSPYSDAQPGPSSARHVLVLHRGHAYAMDVIGPDGRPHGVEALGAGLRNVLAQTQTDAPAGTAVGHLTTLPREDWAAGRSALLAAHPDNRAVLDVVETALCCVCLEEAVPRDVHEACDLLLHGDSGNRWFDKALSFIVFADGRAGLNAEHARLDGTTILGLVDAVLTHEPTASPTGRPAPPEVRPVVFVLDPPLRRTVEQAAAAFAAFAADTATTVLSSRIGTDRIKMRRSSPDAFVQLAFQLAHVRARGLVGATYESIATRHYRHGRTEAMRVVTPEVLAFVDAMQDADADATTRRRAFSAAARAHGERARQCQGGEAPEQHLWELQMLQGRRGLGTGEPLALYESPGWTVLRDDLLSTSSAPSRHVQHFGFGSTSARCIGVAYVLLPDRLNVYLSSTRAVRASLEAFARELDAALAELDDLLAEQGATG